MGKIKMELGLFVSLVILLRLELGVCDVPTNTSLGCIQRERAALLSFKATLVVASFSNNTLLPSWNSSNRDCCAWESVTCHNITGHVITLDLTYGNTPLNAKRVDSSLLELKHLTYLDLSSINFNFKKFPAYLGSLKQLKYLNLSGTYFSGVVPHSLGNLSSLRTLDLSTCGGNLEVDDPMWASRLSSLEHLDMSDVNLSMATHVFEVLYTIPSLLFLSLSNSVLDNTHLPDSSINNSTFLANLQHLDLSANPLQGEFPRFLSNMTSLTFLDLSYNMFNLSSSTHLLGLKKLTHLNLAYEHWRGVEADWPSELLRDKFHLKSLDLNGNGINGDISGVFINFSCHKIESLSLGENYFYGEFPEELGDLSYLMDLDLSKNLFNGPIPTSLGNLSALTSLDVSSNNFSGPLPSSLTNLTSLRFLSLSTNRLSGEIPVSLGKLSNLEIIDISFNCFESTLLEAHFAKLSKLEKLDASFNNMIRFGVGYDWVPPFQITYLNFQSTKMASQFPKWLRTQKALIRLNLANCSIIGSLPAWLRSMISLSVLYLPHNNISGPIPELSSSLQYLDLSDNMITHLPSNTGHMMPLVMYLNLARNLINGSVPDSLCRIEKLSFLDLSKNRFSGNLPNCWSSFNELSVVSFSSNELTGVIPKSIGGNSECLLWRLSFDGNRFTGQLPSTLKNCKDLDLLDVGGNNLSGKLAKWIGKELLHLRFLRMRENEFYGTIPRELCRLSKLQVMDLANNNLSGNIPHCFANFTGMMLNHQSPIITIDYFHEQIAVSSSLSQVIKGEDLEYTTNFQYVVNLDLSSNHLVGEIPWVLTNLSGLLGLNLSHNHLGGQILANIGDMKSLESLDLSNNNLQGMIPYSLSSLNFLSRLNLSNNNLSGQIPGGRQLQTLDDPSIYQGNPLLCGAPLQRKCDQPGIFQDVENHEEEDDEDKADKIWFYGIIIAGFATGFWAVIGGMVVKTKWRRAYFRYIEVAMTKMLGY